MTLTITLPAADVTPVDGFLSTIYVVNWEPVSVGGFEWRPERADAEAYRRSLEDPTVRLYVVAVPPEIGHDAWAITEWLDDQGWSDGIDPRTTTA